MDRWQEHGFGTWTVFARQSDERQGRVELDPMGAGWEGILPGETDLGLIVHPTHWNQGIATEAAGLVAVDCFTRAGLRPRPTGGAPSAAPSLRWHSGMAIPPPRLRANERLAAV